MKWNNHKKANVAGCMVVAVSLLLFSGCAEIKPAVKYQPGQQQATPNRYSWTQ